VNSANSVINVVGAGGIGCVVSWALLSTGRSIRLFERNSAKRYWIQKNGIQLAGWGTQWPWIGQLDNDLRQLKGPTIVCVKTYDNQSVISYLSASFPLLVIQNGIDAVWEETPERISGIASFISESICETGGVQLTRPGDLHIGAENHDHGWTDTVYWHSNLKVPLARIGIKTKAHRDIIPYRNMKFVYNCAISPLASSLGVDNGELLSNAKIRDLFLALLRENIKIFKIRKFPLGKIGPFSSDIVVSILSNKLLRNTLSKCFELSLRGTYCSMAKDFVSGKTEFDQYLGRLIEIAGESDCPLNKLLWEEIVELMNKGKGPDLKLVDRILCKISKT